MKDTDTMSSDAENTPQRQSAPGDASWRERLRGRRPARGIPRLADRGSPPLSFTQERLWLLEQLEPNNPVYNRPLALQLTGPLDESALRQALQSLTARHEVLRTRFTARDGQSQQIISPELVLDLRVIELSEPNPLERAAQARHLATEEALRPFDLAHDPVLRATLLRLGSEEHVLLLVFHHIVFDGWSARVFRDELASLYREFRAGTSPLLPELPIQYADFAHWQRQRVAGELLERQLLYWKQQLRGCVAVDLPTDRPRPSVQSHRGGCIQICLTEPLTDSLKALSRRENATLFMVLLTAFQALLARYTGLEDIAVGTPVAGRNWVETEKLIGIFINILVLRADLAGNPTFRELLARVRETCRGAYSHQDLSFEKLVEALRPERDLSTTPLFQVMFNLENLPEPGSEVPGLRVEEFEFELPVAAYELTVEIVPADRQLKCFFAYNTDLFDHDTMERMAGHYRTLLEGIVAEPDHCLASLPLLTSAERHQILVEWNRTEADYPRDAAIHELFEAQAERTPEATAFFGESGKVSYRDLNRRANQVARCLRSQGAGPESFVGVCLERSPEAVVGLLGALKAGAAFVPLDPAYPRDRLAFMIADAQISLVVSRRKWLPIARGKGARVVCLDSDHRLIEAQEGDNLPSAAGPASVAYVLYTSGSAGVPKGVLGLHRGAVNRFAWMWKNFPFESGDVCCQKASLNFVDSIWEVFGPLLRGIPSAMISDQIVRDPAELVRTLASHAVTRIVTVPSLLRAVLDTYPDIGIRLPLLKLWVSSGEALLPDLCRRFYAAMPNVTLLNLYGSTEVSGDVTAHVAYPAPDSQGTVSLGRPIDNARCYVLDAQLQPVPIGVAGDLYVGGEGLARGYCNRPELTAKRFVVDAFCAQSEARLYKTGDRVRYLPDGNLQFLGRDAQQVKIRGFRVEMEEIETVLTQHPAVSAAAVVVREESPGEKRLVAYVAPRTSTSCPSPKAWRDYLKAKLPDYMIPSSVVPLEALPLTPNGKVDRGALPAAGGQARLETCYVKPRDGLEWQLAKIWEEMLNVRPIGIEHDFFDLGGHSLLAVRMMDRIEDACCRRLPLSALFQEATIKHLVECLRTESRREVRSAIVPVQRGGSLPPFFFHHGDWMGGLYCRKLARLLGDEQPFYGVMPSGFDGDPLLPTVEAMAAENVRHLVALQPRGPYLLGGFCFGGLVAYEMAQQMERRGLAVGLVILLDTAFPRYMGWLKALIRCAGWLARLDADGQTRAYWTLRRYVLHARGAAHKGLGALHAFHTQTVRKELVRLLAGSRREPGAPGPTPEQIQQSLRELRFAGVMVKYQPEPFPGRLVLLRTKLLDRDYPTDRTAGWSKLASQLKVHDLPADHETCRTEQIGVVAEHIGNYLRAYRADAQGKSTHDRCEPPLAKCA